MAIMSLGGDFSVMAVEGGTVIEVVRGSDALGEIIIQHGEGYMSVYKQLGEVLVRKGQHIAAGTVIGRVGDIEMAGEEQSPELVFELWRNGTAVDPERYILF
jgi:septal ring factor EnvC (AmiA/AmiB activator)